MGGRLLLAAAAVAFLAPGVGYAQVADSGQTAATAAAPFVLPMGTPIVVTMEDTLTSKDSKVGDRFRVTVAADVIDRGIVVIPKGTTGFGEVTFSTDKGGFGRAGILGIALRTLELNGKTYDLDGRYREEGKDNGAATGAVMFAAGILGGVVKGKNSTIPKGRELKAHTGEDITYSPPAPAAEASAIPAPSNEAPVAPARPSPGAAAPTLQPTGSK